MQILRLTEPVAHIGKKKFMQNVGWNPQEMRSRRVYQRSFKTVWRQYNSFVFRMGDWEDV